ncbi:methyl-accepting chemotaxis protein [Paenibacillus dakarensis]|uniref:methyl-accepting chemotaxis protein n=1 Tax=Paenibacillus dakarensis TaxID=1527293 RepID=UPI0006D570FD|nr:methyl-accepting chemotaxis protein [Paenibacillus dakarensis]
MNNGMLAMKPLYSLRMKMLSTMLLILVIPVITLGFLSYRTAADETNALIRSGLMNNVNLASEIMTTLNQSVLNGSLSLEESQEEFKRLILGEMRADGSRAINPNLDLGEHGYFYVLDTQGNLLAHPSQEGDFIGDKQTSDGQFYIKDVISAAMNGGGFTYYYWPLPKGEDSSDTAPPKEAEKIVYALQNPSWGWVIAAGSYLQDYNSGEQAILRTILWTLGICLVAGAAIIVIFARHIVKPTIEVANRANTASIGDLTGEPLIVRTRDENSLMASSFNQMIGSMKDLIGSLKLSSRTMNKTAGKLLEVTQETTATVGQTTESIQKVAESSDLQAINIRSASSAMKDMASSVQQVADIASKAYETSSLTLDKAQSGIIMIQSSEKQMQIIVETVGDMSNSISSLNQYSEQITGIVTSMKEISSRINLLALNASIEAARAGNNGKGFAVVASEVRKLATQSNESAMAVSALIETIQKEIGSASTSVYSVETEAAEGVRFIGKTGEAIQDILAFTGQTVEGIQEASAAAEQMSAEAENISSSLDEMKEESEKSSAAAKHVSKAAEEQLASMEQINATAESLNVFSKELESMSNRFRLN